MEIDGSTVLITGAGGAIGAATAEEFARRGARLLLTDRDAAGLDMVAAAVARIAPDAVAEVMVGDVSSPEHHGLLIERAERIGGLDISVLNAGVYLPGLTWEIPLEQYRLQMDVNFWGVLQGVRAAVPGMVARGRGHVVAVSSGAGLIATPGLSPYVASKHAVVGLMESLHHELARVSPAVGTSVVCPGNVRSDMADNSLAAAGIVEQRIDGVAAALGEQVRAGNQAGTEPDLVATAIVEAIGVNRFWVLPHPEIGWAAVDRMERLREGQDPVDLLA